MYFILCALGLIGGPLLGIYGLIHGDAGQLERIWSIMFFALAAAGVIGFLFDDGVRAPRKIRHRNAPWPPVMAGQPAHAT